MALQPKEVSDYVNKLLKKLTNNASVESVYSVLVEIRTKVVKNERKLDLFIRCNSIQLLLPLLLLDNVKIQDITLSILGNCALKKEAQIQIRELDGLTKLKPFLTSEDKNHITRSCRAIGNMALDRESATLLHEMNVVDDLVQLMETLNNSEIIVLAVRAIRNLSQHSESHMKCVLEARGVWAIAKKLTDGQNEVSDAALKSLKKFSLNMSTPCAQQIASASDSLKHLVELCFMEACLKQMDAFFVFTKLSKHTEVQPNLGNAGAITYMLNVIQKQQFDSRDFSFMTYTLASFATHSVNRMKIRDADGLQLLVNLLGVPDCSSHHFLILQCIYCFQYDQTSLEIVISSGIVQVLINLLTDFTTKQCGHDFLLMDTKNPFSAYKRVSTSCNPHPRSQLVKKESLPLLKFAPFVLSPPRSPTNSPERNPSSPGCSYDTSSNHSRESGQLSSEVFPVPMYSPMYLLSTYSPLSSPHSSSSTSENEERELDERCYSPVVHLNSSSDEVEDGPLQLPKIVYPVKGRLLPVRRSKNYLSKKWEKFDCETEKDRSSNIATKILMILSRLSVIDPQHMTNPNTIKGLVHSLTLAKEPSHTAGKILMRIVRHKVCFCELLLHGFISHCDTLDTPAHEGMCVWCHCLGDLSKRLRCELSSVAESPYGVGEMAHGLRYGTVRDKREMLLIIPSVIRSSESRRKLLIDYGIADEYTEFVCDNVSDHELMESLYKLARDISIDLLPPNFTHYEPARTLRCHHLSTKLTKDLTLVLESGLEVHTNRSFLMTKSEVFTAMLSGAFGESEQDKVHICDASHEALNLLIHLVCDCEVDLCELVNNETVDCLIEVISLADRFLVAGLSKEVLCKVLKGRLEPRHFYCLYERSELEFDHACPNLRRDLIKYFLNSKHLSADDRCHVLQTIKSSHRVEQFVSDLFAMLRKKMVKINFTKSTSRFRS